MRESDNSSVSVIAEDGCDWYWSTGARMARHDMCCDDLYTRRSVFILTLECRYFKHMDKDSHRSDARVILDGDDSKEYFAWFESSGNWRGASGLAFFPFAFAFPLLK